jgi:PKD repeat protein
VASVIFTNNSTGNPDSYYWTFGDGGFSSAASPTYTYQSTGIFIVRLTATKGGVGTTIAKAVPILAGATTFTLMTNNEGSELSTTGGNILAAVT